MGIGETWHVHALHVKWFTDQEGIPLAMHEVLTSPFWLWFGVTVVGLLLSAVFNQRLLAIGWIGRVERKLADWKKYTIHLLRLGLAIALVFQLIEGAFLSPEFTVETKWISFMLGAALVALLFERTLWISGLAILVLYSYAVYEYGWFHALDYLFYLGIVYYLLTCRTIWKDSAIPVLYALTGLSFAWVGIEKLTMPSLAVGIIHEFHVPTFGFSPENFVLIAAFIELGLAWTFIVGVLNRFVAILVTLVFIATTTVFGYTEIVGHTIVHTLLIMFILQGGGAFKSPFEFHRRPAMRYLFVVVNFCVLLFGMMAIYIAMGSHSVASG